MSLEGVRLHQLQSNNLQTAWGAGQQSKWHLCISTVSLFTAQVMGDRDSERETEPPPCTKRHHFLPGDHGNALRKLDWAESCLGRVWGAEDWKRKEPWMPSVKDHVWPRVESHPCWSCAWPSHTSVPVSSQHYRGGLNFLFLFNTIKAILFYFYFGEDKSLFKSGCLPREGSWWVPGEESCCQC